MKTGQQSKRGGDDNVGLDGPNHNETNSSDGNDDVLYENRNNEGAKDVCNDADNVGKLMVTMVMVTTVMALLTILVTMTAVMLVTHLTVVTLSVKEKSKGKQDSNLREEVTTIVDLMDLTIMKLTAVMAMTMFLVGTEKKKEANTLAMMTMLLARLVIVTMVMVTTVMALLTILVAMTAMMLLTHLTVVTLLVVPLEPLSAGLN